MYEYKVEIYRIKEAEEAMNNFAIEGWRVISVTANESIYAFTKDTIVVTYEREK